MTAPTGPVQAPAVPEPSTEPPARDWDETPAETKRADRDYWTDRNWGGDYDDPSDHYYC